MNERVFWIILILNDFELIHNEQIWICSYLNIHNLQKHTEFKMIYYKYTWAMIYNSQSHSSGVK